MNTMGFKSHYSDYLYFVTRFISHFTHFKQIKYGFEIYLSDVIPIYTGFFFSRINKSFFISCFSGIFWSVRYLRKNTSKGQKGNLIKRLLRDLSKSPTNSKVDCTPIGLMKTNLKDLDEQPTHFYNHQDLSLLGSMGSLYQRQSGGPSKSPTNSNAGCGFHGLPWTNLKDLDAHPAPQNCFRRDLRLHLNWLVMLAAAFLPFSLQPATNAVTL